MFPFVTGPQFQNFTLKCCFLTVNCLKAKNEDILKKIVFFFGHFAHFGEKKKYLENFNFDFLFGNCSLKYKEEIKKNKYIFIFKVPGINKNENFSTRALLARAAKLAGFLELNS